MTGTIAGTLPGGDRIGLSLVDGKGAGKGDGLAGLQTPVRGVTDLATSDFVLRPMLDLGREGVREGVLHRSNPVPACPSRPPPPARSCTAA